MQVLTCVKMCTRRSAATEGAYFGDPTTEVDGAMLFAACRRRVILLCLAKGIGRIRRIQGLKRALHEVLELQNEHCAAAVSLGDVLVRSTLFGVASDNASAAHIALRYFVHSAGGRHGVESTRVASGVRSARNFQAGRHTAAGSWGPSIGERKRSVGESRVL